MAATGLIAELVRVEKEGEQISRDEMVAMVFLLLFAGHETTTHLISGSVYELLRNPACAIGWRKTGAGLVWRWKNSCDSFRWCNSPNRGLFAKTSNSAASG